METPSKKIPHVQTEGLILMVMCKDLGDVGFGDVRRTTGQRKRKWYVYLYSIGSGGRRLGKDQKN